MKSYLNIIHTHSFIPLISKPTRISKHNATIIDHILTNSFINQNYSTGIVKTDITDHFPTFYISETEVNKTNETTYIFKRKITDDSLSQFKNALATNVDWDNILIYTDPNTAYNEFLRLFLLQYNTFFPKEKIQIKSKNIASPWITKGIIKSSKRKQKLYEKFLKRKTHLNENNYKNYKRLFETIKQKSKANYYNERLNKYQSNVKKTWDVIKEVIGSTKSSSHSFPKRIVVNNKEVLGGKNIAEYFNKYFVNVGPNLADSIPKSNKNFESFLSGNYPLLNEDPLTDDELKNAFTTFKTMTSPGFDENSPDVVKFVFDAVTRPIKHILVCH